MPAPLRSAADQASVRAHNLAAVVHTVRTKGKVSRRDIGDILRLNKATVSSLVGELIALGLLEDGERESSDGPGRRSTMVQVDRRVHASIVVEVRADSVSVSAWSLSLDQLLDRSLPIHPATLGPDATMRRIAAAAASMLGRLRERGSRVTGIVVSLPGLIDVRTGTLVISGPLGWQDVPVRAMLRARRELTDLPIEIGRIANHATIAEWRQIPECTDLICLYGGEMGLGAGAVVNGELLRGARGRAGEVYFPNPGAAVNRSDEFGLLDLARRAGIAGPPSIRQIVDRLDQGDPVTLAAVDDLSVGLAARMASLVALLDPAVIIVGGYFAELGAHMQLRLEKALQQLLAPRPQNDLTLRFGTFGPEAARIGGAILMADRTVTALTVPTSQNI